MANQISGEDIGKSVVYDEETIGRIVAYENETAYVDPDPDVTDVTRSKLGWSATTEESFPLQREVVEEVTDDEVRLTAQL